MSAVLWLQAFTAALMVATVLACSCSQSTASDKLCNENYAAIVQVLDGGTLTSNDRVYRVQTHQVFKSTVSTSSVNTMNLYTNSNSGLCGVTLQPGQTYFVTGNFRDSGLSSDIPSMQSDFFSPGMSLQQVRIALCGLQQQWYRGYIPPQCGQSIGPDVISPTPRPTRPVRPFRPFRRVRPWRFPRHFMPGRGMRRFRPGRGMRQSRSDSD